MFDILKTDFYQVSMCFAYGVLGEANKKVGFEAFVREIKPEIVGSWNHYLFDGENDVIDFMKKIAIEVKNPILPYVIAGLVKDKIKNNPDRYKLIQTFLKNAEKFDSEFEYSVYPQGGKLYPYVPAFQFKGPLWIGQLIETYICNIINGKTGYYSYVTEKTTYGEASPLFRPYMTAVHYNGIDGFFHHKKFLKVLRDRAKEYRESTNKILLEAAFRRAPSFQYSLDASEIALQEGWNGTSNLSLFFKDRCNIQNIGGTMAHSFVMSHRYEIEAYIKWNKVFPNSTILVDTYNVISAIEFLIDAKIKPSIVRIDSDPLDEYTFKVRKILDKNNWNDVKIFISGDLTPEILRDYENRKVPFDMCMAGTKYVNTNGLEEINAGFVYKIVEVHDENGVFFPEKKAIGKKNYSGLKKLTIEDDKLILSNDGEHFGIHFKPEDFARINGTIFKYPEII